MYDVCVEQVTAELLRRDPNNELVKAYDRIVDEKRLANDADRMSIDEFYNKKPMPTGEGAPLRKHPERIDREWLDWKLTLLNAHL